MGVTNYYCVDGEILGDSASGDYLRDALGSVTGTTNPDTGAVQNTYRYKPYGERLAKTGSSLDPKFQWVGTAGYRQTSISHSASYVRARHLGNEEGMWTTVDPFSQFANAYLYALQSPPNIVDESGAYIASCDDVWKETTTILYACGKRFGRKFAPFFCNAHADKLACPVYRPGMTGSMPNTNYAFDFTKIIECNPGDCGTNHLTETYRCKYQSNRPRIFPDLFDTTCGQQVTVRKGKCSVTITIIDRGPALWTGAHVDLHPEAAKAFYECLKPGRKFLSCRNFGRINDVSIS